MVPRLGGGDVANGGVAPNTPLPRLWPPWELPAAHVATKHLLAEVGQSRGEAAGSKGTHTQAVFTIGKTHTLTNPTGTMWHPLHLSGCICFLQLTAVSRSGAHDDSSPSRGLAGPLVYVASQRMFAVSSIASASHGNNGAAPLFACNADPGRMLDTGAMSHTVCGLRRVHFVSTWTWTSPARCLFNVQSIVIICSLCFFLLESQHCSSLVQRSSTMYSNAPKHIRISITKQC